MKKRLLLLTMFVCVMMQTRADVEINSVNFPDDIFRNWILSKSYGSDGVLTDEEITGVTSINVNVYKLKDLKGIEFFTALTELYCSYNQLTSLDVSKNTALTYLSCSNNQLTSLDVSKNTALTELYCSNNQLTTLDVSNNTALTELYCSNNQLTTLDVSNNTALTYLSCGSNQLTSLDVSNNTALTYLSCGSNQLTSLDVSKNTALTYLYCYNNQIKGEKMDALITSMPIVSNGRMYVVSNQGEGNVMTTTQVAAAEAKGWTPYGNNGSWQKYAGIDPEAVDVVINEENFPDENFRNWLLAQGYGSDGILTPTEISTVTNMDVSRKKIKNMQGIELFTVLQSLSCVGNQLTSLDVSKNTALTELYCSNNQLTSLDVSKNTALTELYCSNNQLTTLDVSNNTALTSLYCNGNQLTSFDVSKNTALIYLYCYNNQLTSLDVSKNTALTYLACYNNQLTSFDVSKNTRLTSLFCGGNQLTSLDVSKNTRLTELDCPNNQLTSLDVSLNTALTMLSCSNNQLTSLDVSKNTALYSIYLDRNQVKGVEMYALVESLPTVRYGYIYVIHYEGEGNVMTTTQVAAAKAKGWTPYYLASVGWWREYAGSKPETLRGDVNGDGKVNMDDVTSITNIILGTVATTEAADVNNDGKVGMPDVMFIAQKMLTGRFPDEEAPKEKSIVISKIYSSGSKDSNNKNYMAGRYIELYNQSDQTADVSGMYIALLESGSSSARPWTLDQLTQYREAKEVVAKQIYRMPTDKEYILEGGKSLVVAISATDHSDINDMEHDLSTADFETAGGEKDNLPHNANVTKLENIYSFITNNYTMNLMQGGPCSVILFQTDEDVKQWENTYGYGKTKGQEYKFVPRDCILDGVDFLKNRTTIGPDLETKRLYDEIDAGYTNINALAGYTGEVVYRRTASIMPDGRKILMDTNNSSNDFKVSTTIKPREYDE